MRIYIPALFFSLLLSYSCKKSTPAANNLSPAETIIKPSGIFSSSGSTAAAVLNHTETRGVLIRAFWKDIETTEGNFNFASLDAQINSVKAKGKKYSLGILAGGIGSPDWLITQKCSVFQLFIPGHHSL